MPDESSGLAPGAVEEKQLQAAAYRIAGESYQAIADKLGYAGPSGAHHAAQAAFEQMVDEPRSEAKRVALARLDCMLVGIWEKASAGNQAAIDRVLKLEERRAKLTGLDLVGGPAKPEGESQIERARRARANRRSAAAG